MAVFKAQIIVLLFGTPVAIYGGIHQAHRFRCAIQKRRRNMETEKQAIETCNEEPRILEEIQVEELAIDGICGVY